MNRSLALAYGIFCYLIFIFSFTYAIGFIGGLVVPRTIDVGGPPASPMTAALIDAILLAVFAVQHSLMARPAFKAAWTKIVPTEIERSTYVLVSSLALALICWQWRPMAQPIIWRIAASWLVDSIWALFALGWLIVLTSTFLINHFDLFGLRQVWTYRRSGETSTSEFTTPLFYRVVRHPLYLGFIIAFWAAPRMTLGHLMFAGMTTAYILIAIQFEEHDLINLFGDRYRRYQNAVSMIIPWLPGKSG